jgi:hypothetical protein
MSATCEITLSGTATASSFDDALQSGLSAFQTGKLPTSVLLNMSGLTFTDLQNMQRIICFADFCHQNGTRLNFDLPSNLRLLRFWHSWNFFETIEDVTGIPVRDMVDESQHESLAFDGLPHKDDETVKLLAPNIPNSRRQNFFSFFSDKVENTSKNSIASREKHFWERDEVIDVLHRVFGENFGDNIGSDIVSETLFNSTRHSNASIISSASFCKAEPGKDGRRNFQLVIWDNGEPIYQTLRKPLLEDKVVREYSARNFRERSYLVSYPEFPKKAAMHSSHGDPINKNDKDSQLMLSALFPGVTSKPFSDQDSHAAESDKNAEVRIQRGMGFDFVLETAIHGLGGKVSIRSGQYFAQIEKVKDDLLRDHIRKIDTNFNSSDQKGKKPKPVPNSLLKKYHRDYFSVSFRQIPDVVPPLNGNLIYISV